VNYQWRDSFTKATIASQNTQFEVLSNLFNFGATLAREARYADLKSPNGH